MIKNTFLKLLGLSIVCLSLMALLPSKTNAAEIDCGKDPVYERNFSAVTTVGSRVRSIACMTGSKILTVLPAKTIVSVIGETDGWYKVKAGDKIGWVGSQLLKKVSDDGVTQAVEKISETPKASALVGISENNYTRLKAGNKGLVKLLKNKIILRVHAKGQAYFVNADGLLTYLKNSQEVNKYLKSEVKKEEKTEAKENDTVKKTDKPISISGTITLSAVLADPGKVKLTWTTDGVDAPAGFKVVVSEKENPVYPGNDYHYLSNPSIRQDTWSGLGNKTYHFRVCEYLGGYCGAYSNDVTVKVE